ncbi:MAG: DUF3990 domain-containing protein [Candidatus Amulumruptor sp.]
MINLGEVGAYLRSCTAILVFHFKSMTYTHNHACHNLSEVDSTGASSTPCTFADAPCMGLRKTGTSPTCILYWIHCSCPVSTALGGIPTVTEFDFDIEHASDSLNIKLFDSPNEEWAKFVMRNRRIGAKLHEHDFDIVIGPVADDDIAYLIRNFENGFIDMKRLLEELQFKRFTSQYFFHSPESIKFLHKC